MDITAHHMTSDDMTWNHSVLIRKSNSTELPIPLAPKSSIWCCTVRDGPDNIPSNRMALLGDSIHRSVSESLSSIGRVGKSTCDAFCKCLSWVVCCSSRAPAPAIVPLPVHAVTSRWCARLQYVHDVCMCLCVCVYVCDLRTVRRERLLRSISLDPFLISFGHDLLNHRGMEVKRRWG